MGNKMSSPQYHGRETLHSAGSGVESEWREVGRSEMGGRGGARIDKGDRVVLQSGVSPTQLTT